jgi:hypothetical protein
MKSSLASYVLVGILSILATTLLSALGYTITLYVFKRDVPAASHRLIKTKTRVVFSMIGGAFAMLLYLIGVMDQRNGVNPTFLFELAMQAVLFAIVCSIGCFVGATITSRLLGSRNPFDQGIHDVADAAPPDAQE